MTFVGYYTGELIDYLFYPTDISGVKEVTYTIDSENVRTHSLEEAGFMFNIGVRAEFAAIIVRALGLPETGDASKFSDVASSAWYYGSVGKAAEYGIILGRGDGTFAPNEYITRQDAMLMIQRAAGISEYTDVTTGSTAKFTDLNTVSDYAKSGMYWNLSNGFIVGHNGLVRPQETISRAECATIVLRLLQKSGLVDVRTQT